MNTTTRSFGTLLIGGAMQPAVIVVGNTSARAADGYAVGGRTAARTVDGYAVGG